VASLTDTNTKTNTNQVNTRFVTGAVLVLYAVYLYGSSAKNTGSNVKSGVGPILTGGSGKDLDANGDD
jgi:hypothetical protein